MKTIGNASQVSTSDLVDARGDLIARASDLEAQIKKIDAVLKGRIAAGEGSDGDIFRAVHIVTEPGWSLDKDMLVERYGHEWVADHSKPTKVRDFIKTNARIRALGAA